MNLRTFAGQWCSLANLLLMAPALLALSAGSLRADTVFSCAGTSTQDSSYTQSSGGSTAGGFAGTATYASTAPGDTQTSGGRYCQGGATADSVPWVQLAPTLGTAGGTYVVYGTRGSDASVSANVVMNISAVANCSVSASTTTFFQSGQATLNNWKQICTLTLNAGQTTPTIKFTYHSGTVSSSSRVVSQGYKFDLFNPCANTAAVDIKQSGPIEAGQTTVVVTGVSASATAVKVYKNGATLIGTKSTGVTAGDNSVTVSPALAKGDVISATQTIGGQEGCVPSTGLTFNVGSGAPNKVRFAIGLRNTASAAAPLGFNGGTSGNIYLLGASAGQFSQFTPPTGIPAKNIITAGVGWQTLTFTNGVDPCWNGSLNSSAASVPGNAGAGASSWAVLEGLYIVPDDNTDTGEYKIYLDNVKNGDAVLQDFEGSTNGDNDVTFGHPSVSGTTSGSILLNNSPPLNLTQVTTNNPDIGSKCALTDFQFNGVNSGNWLRLTTSGANLTPNPSVDVTKPITIRVLLLPLNKTAALNVSQPVTISTTPGVATNVMVAATDSSGGSSTISYQWKKNGVVINSGNSGDLTGYNTPTLNFTNPIASDAGNYSCLVTNAVTGANAGTYTAECNQFAVGFNKGGSSASLTSSTNLAQVGSNVTFTVMISPAVSGAVTPTGTIQLRTNGVAAGPPVVLVNSTASFSTAALAGGTNSVVAEYAGDANYLGSTNTTTQIVNRSPTASDAGYSIASGVSLKIKIADLMAAKTSDPDGDTVTLDSLGASLQGARILTNGGYILYMPSNSNNDSFSYTVSDGRGGSATAAIAINIVKAGGLPQSITISNGVAAVNCSGIPGYPYAVQRSTNLVDWVTLVTTNAPANGQFSCLDDFSDLGGPPTSAYYRTAQP